MRILAITTGRADATPLTPVIAALKKKHDVRIADWEGWYWDEPDPQHEVDLAIVLGDRFEALSAALYMTVHRIPIAHIHGGEITRGSFDNQIRDAITKLSHIHFAATEKAAERIADLGEKNIHVVGAPGLDNLTDLPKRHIKDRFVITYHPPTLSADPVKGVLSMMEALRHFPWCSHIYTSVNNDPGSDEVKKELTRYTKDERMFNDITPREYHLECRRAAVVIGNSSSGVIECPTIGVPSVNIGLRQDGREMGPSVFCCGEDEGEIREAIQKALDYRGPFTNPYGGPGASKKIAAILETLDPKSLTK